MDACYSRDLLIGLAIHTFIHFLQKTGSCCCESEIAGLPLTLAPGYNTRMLYFDKFVHPVRARVAEDALRRRP